MIKIIAAVALTQFALVDQFDHKVDWPKFAQAPKILIFAGKRAAEQGRAWGIKFQTEFNGAYKPTRDHLQTLAPSEKVKIIAVVALPDIPKFFHSLVRGGLRSAAPDFGMAVDYSSRLSKAFGYDQANESVQIVAISASGETLVVALEKNPKESREKNNEVKMPDGELVLKKIKQTLGL